MELKSASKSPIWCALTSSNRTFMELKFDEVEEVKVWRVVLIAPLWN